MKKAFSVRTLQRDYVFRFRICNYNFTCKLICVDKGFDGLLDVPYVSYRCIIYSTVFRTTEIRHLLSFPHNINYRTFRNTVQDEVSSHVYYTFFI